MGKKIMSKEKRILIPEGTHTCKQCKKVKDNSKFFWTRMGENSSNLKRLGNTCNGCKTYNKRKVDKLKKLVPIPEDGKCQCCGKKTKIFLDHDHTDDEFRGWLCQDCNLGIGRLGDSEEGLRMALRYMRSAPKRKAEVRRILTKKQK